MFEKIIDNIKGFFSGIPEKLSLMSERRERRRADKKRIKEKKQSELPAERVKERVTVVKKGIGDREEKKSAGNVF
ncbi:MAG: hypothetical protein MJ137_08050, partial [Clostridia bacterium]|nr:hypothetical protein [Clostridia bacterium]